MRLNQQARAELQDANIKPSQWPQLHGQEPGSTWRGDKCGCPDDRCIGYHHDADETCGCLAFHIGDHWKNVRAGEEGKEVWALHEHANTTGAPDDRATADQRLAAWIDTYHPIAVTYGFTDRGITYRNQYNDHTWLVFDAQNGQVTTEKIS